MPLLLLLLHSDRIIYILITLQTCNPLKPESNLTLSCSAKENKDLPLFVTYYCANIMWLLCSRLVCDWQTGNTQEGRLSSGVSYMQTLSPLWPWTVIPLRYGPYSCLEGSDMGTEAAAASISQELRYENRNCGSFICPATEEEENLMILSRSLAVGPHLMSLLICHIQSSSWSFSLSETLETSIIWILFIYYMYTFYAWYEIIQNIIGKINTTTTLKFLQKGQAICPTSWWLCRSVSLIVIPILVSSAVLLFGLLKASGQLSQSRAQPTLRALWKSHSPSFRALWACKKDFTLRKSI